MSFAADDFTDTAGTTLPAHTPSGGGSWTRVPIGAYSGVDAVVSNANRARISQQGTTAYYHSGAPASADYDVTADCAIVAGSSVAGGQAIGRQSTTDGSAYAFGASNSTTAWQLFRIGTSGGTAGLGSFSDTMTDGTTRAIKLEMRGTTLKGYVDGSAVVTVTNSTVTAAGKAGVRFSSNNTAGSDSTFYHLDNFAGADPGAVASTPGCPFVTVPETPWYQFVE